MKHTSIGNAIIALILVGALTFGLLAGCSGDQDPLAPDTALFRDGPVEITDAFLLKVKSAPIEFDDLILVLKGISAHRSSDDALDGWYDLDIEPTEYSFLDLNNVISALIAQLAENELPPGIYGEIRLLLADGNRIVIDGEEFDLSAPPGPDGAIRIRNVFEIIEGEEFTAAMSFDTSRFVAVNGRGIYSLKPVLRVVETASVGNIIGIVEPVDAEAMISTETSAGTAIAYADLTTGEFILPDLPAGTYTLTFKSTGAIPYPTLALVGIEVTAGITTDIGVFTMMVPVK